MLTFLIRRLAQLLFVAFVLSIAVFLLIRAIPGDPAMYLAGASATPDQVAAVRTRFGLDQPLPAQYVHWLGNILHGDLGRSYTSQFPVSELVAQRLPATLSLALASLALALLLSFPLGVLSALHEGRGFDVAVSVISGIFLGVPTFWLGLLLILGVSLRLNWLPPNGYADPVRQPGEWLHFAVLPVLTLALPLTATFTRFIRSELLEVLSNDYVRTARAKGISETAVMLRHVLSNAMIPVVTAIGLQFTRLMGGAVIVETIFAWPGIGRLTTQAIAGRDYSVVQGVLLLLAIIFALISFGVDLAYAALDPRLRVQR